MAPTVAGNIIRVAARHAFANVDEVINVHHFNVSTAPGAPADDLLLEDLAVMLGDAYETFQAFMSTTIAALDITVYNVTQDYPVGVTGWGAGYVGGISGADGMPPGTSELLLWRTGVKRVLGKTFLPPTIESAQTDGQLTSACRTAMSALAAQLLSAGVQPNDYAFTKVVWSDQAGLARPIITYQAAAKIAYQRRRKAGVGS